MCLIKYENSAKRVKYFTDIIMKSRPRLLQNSCETGHHTLHDNVNYTVASKGGAGRPGWHHLKGWHQEEKINEFWG